METQLEKEMQAAQDALNIVITLQCSMLQDYLQNKTNDAEFDASYGSLEGVRSVLETQVVDASTRLWTRNNLLFGTTDKIAPLSGTV